MMWTRHERGLHVVALFEAVKGALVLLLGFGLLALTHQDLEDVAERLASYLHLNPASYYPRIFIEAASKLTDGKLWLFASLAFAYALFRFVEAYGLWKMRPWAEWLALISGGIYIPIELYELIQKVTWVRILLLTTNVAIVLYMALIIFQQRHPPDATASGERAG